MDIAMPVLKELVAMLGPAGAIVALLLLTPAGRAMIVSLFKQPPKATDTQTFRINGHPCAMHEGLVESIREIKTAGDSHHDDQQRGIDRIHERIDELYRDMVKR